jgi:molybdopterin-guanine dinucleotide biosynthesis protein
MKKVIAFTGHKLNGKTTASNHLMQRFLSESETPASGAGRKINQSKQTT